MDGTFRVSTHPSSVVKEEHSSIIYCIDWSKDILVDDDQSEQQRQQPIPPHAPKHKRKSSLRYFRCFATSAGRHATIYKVEVFMDNPGKPSGPIMVHQSYQDPHPDEEFFACAFGGRSFLPDTVNQKKPKRNRRDIKEETDDEAECGGKQQEVFDPNRKPTGLQLLCLAGKCFAIKLIDTTQQKLWMTLSGHGDEVTCLKFSPADEFMLVSASNDKSCRIWNVLNGTCVAILTGHEGHRDIILMANWHCLGTKIVTGGHDNLVKIWNVDEGTAIHDAMMDSYKIQLQRRKENAAAVEPKDFFKPVICQFPIFSSHKLHYHPIDCVEFIGDLVLSKGANAIVLFDPDYVNQENPLVLHPAPASVTALKTFVITGASPDIMFYRFCTCPNGRMIAVGNMASQVLLFDINSKGTKVTHKLEVNTRVMTAVRMTAWSPDGRILLSCCDDGTITKWDIKAGST